MKKRTLYLTTLTIITVVCAIIGVLVHVVFTAGNWALRLIDEDTDFSQMKGATTYEELDAFHNINLDLRVSDVSILYGDTYGIKYSSKEERWIPTYKIENDTLYVKQNVKKASLDAVKCNCKIQIILPKDTTLSTIQGTLNVGDFTTDRVNASSVDFDLNTGDITLSDASYENITLQTDVGDIDLDNVSFLNADVNSSVGDIDVDSSKSLKDYAMDLSCDIGEVDVNDNDHGRNYQANENSNKKLTASASTGDVDVEY